MPIRVLSSVIRHVTFRSFDNPGMVDGGYAVLSHRWHNVEQTYAESLSLAEEEVAIDSPRLSSKVRECHRLACTYGLSWFWVDAPCIDQRNSAELSEAIASMYDWYAQATICFAYLVDVPPGDVIRDPGSGFRRSVYFRRGWTLQELIAPHRVVFLYNDWSVAGEKDELADILEEITGIDRDVLTFCRALSDVSVARRLSWASKRETSREEDMAYCLMGLFGIHMPIMYGERSKAFVRLQQIILQEFRDHTILAWTPAADSYQDIHASSVWPFAPSPAAFQGASRLVTVDMERFVGAVSPLCEASSPREQPFLPCIGPVNHHGIYCTLPVLYHGSTPLAALLACQEDHSTTSYVALAFDTDHPSLPGVYVVAETHTRPMKPSKALKWPPSRLLRVNMDLLAPLVAEQRVSARVAMKQTALHLRFASFHITAITPSLLPATSSLREIPPDHRSLSSPAPTLGTFGSSSTQHDEPHCTDIALVSRCSHLQQTIQVLYGAFRHLQSVQNATVIRLQAPPRR